jgi:methyl-accepting chemotaxis protein
MQTLSAKTLIAFLLIAALNAAEAQSSDSAVINLAGAERMLSQKMTKEALLLDRGGDRAALAASMKRFDRVLQGLVEGDAQLQLPRSKDPEILSGLSKVRTIWQPIRSAIEQTIAKPNADQATGPVVEGNLTLLTQMDQVVKLFEQRARAKVETTLRLQIAITGCLTILLFIAWRVVLGKVIQPLNVAVDYVTTLSSGDLTSELDAAFRDRGDEIGVLSRAMQTMSANLRSMIGEVSGKTRVVLSSSVDLQANASRMSSDSRDTSDRAHSVAAAAEQMSVNAASVAAGMEQTTTNLSHVASATEAMTSTMGEIAGNSQKARRITGEATRQASEVTGQIARLGKAADEIGRVTQTITEISAQTNLLALNATIEAARAGASGKGFAVVATEIKALAQEAAAASEEIRERIASVQAATAGSVGQVERISSVIGEVDEIVSSIAAAIDQYSAVAGTIARNIAEANAGVSDTNIRIAEGSLALRGVAEDIARMDRAAGDMAANSDQVSTNSVELAAVSEQLQQTVARFRV